MLGNNWDETPRKAPADETNPTLKDFLDGSSYAIRLPQNLEEVISLLESKAGVVKTDWEFETLLKVRNVMGGTSSPIQVLNHSDGVFHAPVPNAGFLVASIYCRSLLDSEATNGLLSFLQKCRGRGLNGGMGPSIIPKSFDFGFTASGTPWICFTRAYWLPSATPFTPTRVYGTPSKPKPAPANRSYQFSRDRIPYIPMYGCQGKMFDLKHLQHSKVASLAPGDKVLVSATVKFEKTGEVSLTLFSFP
ncbi:hypothetical protein BDR26DRAFT_995232 [Obelidium mucronatum]|nr:hypothetical protein BDR26DRAFT_995232 [Obelidium mucronatum]